MRRTLTSCLALTLATALSAAQPNPNPATSFRVSPLLVMKTAEPGEPVRGRLLVSNPADEAVSLSVTPRDFTTDPDGKETWLAYGTDPSSLQEWISFAPSYLEVPARGEASIDYEILVPEAAAGHAAPRGSRWSALAIQLEQGRRPLVERPAAGSGPSVGMRVSLVYAVKIFVSVAGTEERSLEALSLLPGARPGSLRATFVNRGNVVLRPRVWMEIRGLEGDVLGRVDALKWTLPPAREHRYHFELAELDERLEDGRYQVVVIADYGGARLEGVAAPLVLRAGASGP